MGANDTSDTNYQLLTGQDQRPIKAWIRGVPLEPEAEQQLRNIARLPFIHKWVAVMPDVHLGIGATVGSVVPTHKAIIPAAVGVDIGCGMMAVRTTLAASQLPDNLHDVRTAIEKAVPHGRTDNGGRNDRGAWRDVPEGAAEVWKRLDGRFKAIVDEHPVLRRPRTAQHLGTLGSGNHFIEVCLDADDRVWLMLHSGSRGIGNAIGRYFIELAKEDVTRQGIKLPDRDLAYFAEGSQHFAEYVRAVGWAQDFARTNRELMMANVVDSLRKSGMLPAFTADVEVVNCHHNYVQQETHFGESVWVTRKGAVKAGLGDLGIIPGSMGTRSYIVRGLGNPDSFHSCSHGAGRAMSRTEAKRRFTVEDHIAATRGIECRKDKDVVDETPAAYKSIDAVMEAQKDLVEIVHRLRQVVCVKG